ncbi:MAG: SUMF1/EgtB/PvdO family nonheme iron enzyme, partial [Clostridia bacterium]|nr:SUMF1/EgtB/PvdO family nonheme iron enzyme [Clostridia bacterium]
TTGASRQTEKYHIYDVAGNLWEWTDEASLYKAGSASETNVQYRVLRGGGYMDSSATYPVCYRYGPNVVSHTGLDVGFRVVLYIK